jgi:hypothetical protein
MGSCSSEGLFADLSRGLVVSKPKHHRRARWHRSTLSVLAVLPAVGLAAVALAAPARAEDQPLSPVSPSAVRVDRSVTIVVDAPDPVVVSEVPASPVQATPPLPVASEPSFEDDAVEVPESPANGELVPVGSVEEPAAPAPPPAPQISVISPPEPARALAPKPSARKPVKRASRARIERQYQSAREQYHVETAPVGSRSEGAAPAGEPESAAVSERSTSGPTIGGVGAPSKPAGYCVEARKDDQWNCTVDPDWKPNWNCNWIQGCILEPPLEEASPEASDPGDGEVPEVPDCDEAATPGAQYQPTGGQYQPGDAEDAAVEDPVDEDASDSSEEVGCEEDSSDEAPAVPSPPQQPQVGPSSGSDVPLEQPAPAPADAVEVPEPGSGESSAPPPAAGSGRGGTAVAPPGPVGKGSGDDGWRLVVGGEREQVGAVLGSTIEHQPQLHVDARRQATRQSTKTSPKPKPNPAPALPKRVVPELPIRVVASPPLGSAPAEPFADGVRLLALAMALSGLGLLGLALMGPIVRVDGNLLGQLVALVRSKGLSRSATAVDGSDQLDERSAGIRYRD